MIRINLLGAPKPKNKRGGAAVSAAAVMDVGEVGSPKLKVAVVLALALTVNFLYWTQLNKVKKRTETAMAAAEDANRKLADVKARFLERQRQRRVDVIDQLRASAQTGPVPLLNMIGDTVNGTEAVWLNSMKDQGSTVDIEGMALSTSAVADLITNLQKSGYFKNIEIKETYQDDTYKEIQAFQFTLTCEKGKS